MWSKEFLKYKKMEYGIKMNSNGLFYLTKTVKWWLFRWDVIIDSGSFQSMEEKYERLQ